MDQFGTALLMHITITTKRVGTLSDTISFLFFYYGLVFTRATYFSLVFCNSLISACNVVAFIPSCFTYPVINLIITSCLDTFLFKFFLDVLFTLSRTTSLPLSVVHSLTLFVALCMLGYNTVWTSSSSNLSDNKSESVLCICTRRRVPAISAESPPFHMDRRQTTLLYPP